MKIKQTMNNIPACGEDLKASLNQKVTTKKVLSLQASFKKRKKKSRKLYTLQRHCLHPSISLCDVFRLKKPVGLSSKTLDKSFDLLIKFLLLSAFDISGKLYPLATTKKVTSKESSNSMTCNYRIYCLVTLTVRCTCQAAPTYYLHLKQSRFTALG